MEHLKSLSSERLVSMKCLGKIETTADSRGKRLAFVAATAVAKDCFLRMKTPKWTHPFFTLAPLNSLELIFVGEMVDGVSLVKYTLVHPCWCVCCRCGFVSFSLLGSACRREPLQHGDMTSQRQSRYHQQASGGRRRDASRVE